VKYGYANGLEEETEKMRYDFFYIKHQSWMLDLRIIVETLGVLLLDRRSHEVAKTRLAPGSLPDPNAVS
jgi:lipopolysaccharide/colanic/teichoic acid biosynthesis glycosyltransferase